MAARRCLGRCGRIIHTGAACRPRNGSTRSWRQTRALVLYRDAFTCQNCRAAANTVDHIRPVIFGGTDDVANLQAMCAACKCREGRRAARSGLNGASVYVRRITRMMITMTVPIPMYIRALQCVGDP